MATQDVWTKNKYDKQNYESYIFFNPKDNWYAIVYI